MAATFLSTGLGSLIKLLPTGTVFLFQFLNPVLTNNGKCSHGDKVSTSILIAVFGFFCGFSSFTDSYKDRDGATHYVIATFWGLWPNPAPGLVNLPNNKLRFRDFVHSILSLIVFAVLSLLDTNTVHCFYPSFESSKLWKKISLLKALPLVIGGISGIVFMLFPNTRHGIGYPSS